MQINANLVIKRLDDEPLKDGQCTLCGQALPTPTDLKDRFYTVGSALSSVLMRMRPKPGQKTFDAVKALELAKKFYKNPTVEVDASDIATLKELVEEDEVFTPLISGQVIMHLNKLIASETTDKEEKTNK